MTRAQAPLQLKIHRSWRFCFTAILGAFGIKSKGFGRQTLRGIKTIECILPFERRLQNLFKNTRKKGGADPSQPPLSPLPKSAPVKLFNFSFITVTRNLTLAPTEKFRGVGIQREKVGVRCGSIKIMGTKFWAFAYCPFKKTECAFHCLLDCKQSFIFVGVVKPAVHVCACGNCFPRGHATPAGKQPLRASFLLAETISRARVVCVLHCT